MIFNTCKRKAMYFSTILLTWCHSYILLTLQTCLSRVWGLTSDQAFRCQCNNNFNYSFSVLLQQTFNFHIVFQFIMSVQEIFFLSVLNSHQNAFMSFTCIQIRKSFWHSAMSLEPLFLTGKLKFGQACYETLFLISLHLFIQTISLWKISCNYYI